MIQIHSQLNPDLWEDNNLKLDVKSHLLKISKAFYDTLKINTEVQDIILTGSSANFNYTAASDIDLHILLNFDDVTCEEEFVQEFFLAKKSIWNNEHNIIIKNREVEVYVQDTKEPHVSTGVYSILNNKWIIKPNKSNFYLKDTNREEILHKFKHLKDIIDFNIHKKTNFTFLKKLKKKITQMRKQGLANKGEMDVKNLVFKELRNRKYIDKLTNAINSEIDSDLSLETFSAFLYAKK